MRSRPTKKKNDFEELAAVVPSGGTAADRAGSTMASAGALALSMGRRRTANPTSPRLGSSPRAPPSPEEDHHLAPDSPTEGAGLDEVRPPPPPPWPPPLVRARRSL